MVRKGTERNTIASCVTSRTVVNETNFDIYFSFFRSAGQRLLRRAERIQSRERFGSIAVGLIHRAWGLSHCATRRHSLDSRRNVHGSVHLRAPRFPFYPDSGSKFSK